MPCQSLPEAGDMSIIVVPLCNEGYEKEVGIMTNRFVLCKFNTNNSSMSS